MQRPQECAAADHKSSSSIICPTASKQASGRQNRSPGTAGAALSHVPALSARVDVDYRPTLDHCFLLLVESWPTSYPEEPSPTSEMKRGRPTGCSPLQTDLDHVKSVADAGHLSLLRIRCNKRDGLSVTQSRATAVSTRVGQKCPGPTGNEALFRTKSGAAGSALGNVAA